MKQHNEQGPGRGQPQSNIDAAEVLRLRDQEDKSWNQIADVLKTPRTTIREVYRRAKQYGEFPPSAKNRQRPSQSTPGSPSNDCHVGDKDQADRLRDDSALAVIHVFGVAARPDGTGGYFITVNTKTRRKHVENILNEENSGQKLDKLAATWFGVISAVGQLPRESPAEIIVSEPLLVAQWSGRVKVAGRLGNHCLRARLIARNRALDVELVWLPRKKNLAAQGFKQIQQQAKRMTIPQ